MSTEELARRLADTDTVAEMVDLLEAVGPGGREEFRRWLADAVEEGFRLDDAEVRR